MQHFHNSKSKPERSPNGPPFPSPGMRTCTLGHHLVGLQGNVVDPQGNFGDDLGVDNLRMECDDGDILDGLYGVPNAQVSEPLV